MQHQLLATNPDLMFLDFATPLHLYRVEMKIRGTVTLTHLIVAPNGLDAIDFYCGGSAAGGTQWVAHQLRQATWTDDAQEGIDSTI